MTVASRVIQAITDELTERDLEQCSGGTISVVVKLDASGCVRRIAVRTEVEREVERRRPRAMVG